MTAPRPAIDAILDGAVDLHCHSGPSPFPRRIDHVEAARQADSVRMRAIVVKSHHHSTVMDVKAMAEQLRDTTAQIFGGIALNAQVGGLNPSAVDMALKLGGKIVWFPTISSSRHIEHQTAHPDLKFPQATVPLRKQTPIDITTKDGDVRPEVVEILRSIAEAGAVVSGGHMGPDQIGILLDAARRAGVTRMLVSHPEYVIEASREQVVAYAEAGALIEHCLCMYDDESEFYHWDTQALKGWIDLVGADHTSLGSDLGQKDNPLPTAAFRKILGRLHDCGVSEADLRKMVRDNPARLLGLS
ncbi:MAG: DUF6282 family protein [Acidimicrobiia bacterium]